MHQRLRITEGIIGNRSPWYRLVQSFGRNSEPCPAGVCTIPQMIPPSLAYWRSFTDNTLSFIRPWPHSQHNYLPAIYSGYDQPIFKCDFVYVGRTISVRKTLPHPATNL